MSAVRCIPKDAVDLHHTSTPLNKATSKTPVLDTHAAKYAVEALHIGVKMKASAAGLPKSRRRQMALDHACAAVLTIEATSSGRDT